MERFHRLLAAVLLLAYVGTGTPCFSMVTLVLAELEGSHTVLVSESAQGTRVQLHHRDCEHTLGGADHTSALARLIVIFSKDTEEGDHVLSSSHLISSRNTTEVESELEVKEPQEVEDMAYRLQPISGHQQRPTFPSSYGSLRRCPLLQHQIVSTTRLLI